MKLKEIVFETNAEEIHLDIEDAKTLYKQLDELFGDKNYLPSAPIFIERDKWAKPYRPFWYSTPLGEPACSVTNNNVTMSLIGDKT